MCLALRAELSSVAQALEGLGEARVDGRAVGALHAIEKRVLRDTAGGWVRNCRADQPYSSAISTTWIFLAFRSARSGQRRLIGGGKSKLRRYAGLAFKEVQLVAGADDRSSVQA